MPKINKFSVPELFSNSNGKTSSTAFVGVVICLVGTLCFLLGCLDKIFINDSIDIITQSITFVMIGAGLLGIRRYTKDKEIPTSAMEDVLPVNSNGQSANDEIVTEEIYTDNETK